MKKAMFTAALAFFAISSAVADDSGKVSWIVANQDGGVGFMLVGGFKSAKLEGLCNSPNGFAALPKDPQKSKGMLAVLLAAKAMDKPVTVATLGCSLEWPGWFRVHQIYLID